MNDDSGDHPAPAYGTFRGTVTDNVDKYSQGRLEVKVPRATGVHNVWAEPCVPFASKDVGLFAMPDVGTAVWVEFVEGDLNFPIWTGCMWQKGECPVSPSRPGQRVLATKTATITIDEDEEMGIIIETKAGARLAITKSGIEISNGSGASIELSNATVSVNGGALEVT